MQQAEAMIKAMNADLGGTELLKPLQWLKTKNPPKGCARQIFLLTDGEVSNVNEVTNLCREMATYTRIFSFGLGHSVSDRFFLNEIIYVSFSFYSQVMLLSKVLLVLPMATSFSLLHSLM
jgi:hypothetical protein